ncbi:hypothetical protein CLAFUW4_14558 [Fulvia fulva]|uniref:Vacuolar ATPase assembly protein VMA22 n=1 Tax=Passalora fulva TaxID=5499 RepID=A0A9Q8PMK7_PASFU|nr:uncharacterized protein CLAFUR5_14388 [Fulvia fulva]KAK4609001.1 hypothetical protein CLAFUR4_14552 [Fulvia fulva]KAK4609675.1 hypothetical protein CLAFUR0_14552 [Fulvia fulva]UJO25202.1 hypothetical protein CLAFUR5_14388 [Fulvia fulva]WPV22747.1 hypothetical protein CLAFUW4_14558 [Fulvia fulva]WPV37801.1 hypothetical protein CLAFUW7_14561 [Fulvia fulva]
MDGIIMIRELSLRQGSSWSPQRVMLAKLDPPKAEITGMEEETLSGKLSKATFDSKVETSAEEKSKSEPQSATSTDNNEEASAKPPVDAHDPIRQFGILLPPALRTAQNSFNSAVLNDDCIAKAVEAARGMRRVEAEIRKLRKEARKSERGERLRGAGGVDVGGG